MKWIVSTQSRGQWSCRQFPTLEKAQEHADRMSQVPGNVVYEAAFIPGGY